MLRQLASRCIFPCPLLLLCKVRYAFACQSVRHFIAKGLQSLCGFLERKQIMGRGDQRSAKGKVFAGSFGNRRPRKGKKAKAAATAAKPA